MIGAYAFSTLQDFCAPATDSAGNALCVGTTYFFAILYLLGGGGAFCTRSSLHDLNNLVTPLTALLFLANRTAGTVRLLMYTPLAM